MKTLLSLAKELNISLSPQERSILEDTTQETSQKAIINSLHSKLSNKITDITQQWIQKVVIDCNFCPFAAREVRLDSIRYQVIYQTDLDKILEQVLQEYHRLDKDENIATTLLIFPLAVSDFYDYLHLVELSERLLSEQGYDGIYQIASFHPQYLFAGSDQNDPSNYTNRSVFPMLHFLRENSVTNAVDSHPDIDSVPQKNIEFTQTKGLAFMQQLLQACKN